MNGRRTVGWLLALLVLIVIVLGAPATGSAQEAAAAPQPPKFDVGPLLSRLSVCSAIGMRATEISLRARGHLLAGGCYAPFSWTWGSLNVGPLWKGNHEQTGVGGGMVAVWARADKAWAWAWRKADLERRGVQTHFVVPQIEAGPIAAWHQSTGWLIGFGLKGSWPSWAGGSSP